MTILHLRNSDLFSSPERLILGQCRYLSEFDFVCASFVRRKQQNRFLDECRKQGVPTEQYVESFRGDWRVIRQIRHTIQQHQINLVVSHDYKATFFGYLAAKRSHVPLIAYFHGLTAEDRRVKLYNFIDRLMLKRLRRIITVSSLTRQLLIDRGVDPESIEVVPNAIDPASLNCAQRGSTTSKDIIDVIAAGRFSYEKGFDLLLRAVAMIRQQAPRFHLHLYGQGPEEDRLRRMTDELGLKETVSFCGFVDDILPVLSKMDLLVISSRSEGMPVILLEAWSQQVGVLATAVGGVPELVVPEENGLLVPGEEVSQLAEKLLRALRHPDEINRFGQNGYHLVKEKYTYLPQAELLRKIYAETVTC